MNKEDVSLFNIFTNVLQLLAWPHNWLFISLKKQLCIKNKLEYV